ncbi:MAG: hypothetical protein NZM12_11055, partial [Steroidobacteraceae bacterium]|nr:hypothetical protein [Steroidobacteraceae bacterium]MDW8258358.1 hypothetical protein [Gammaproteobacteria bacterium]
VLGQRADGTPKAERAMSSEELTEKQGYRWAEHDLRAVMSDMPEGDIMVLLRRACEHVARARSNDVDARIAAMRCVVEALERVKNRKHRRMLIQIMGELTWQSCKLQRGVSG